MSGEAVALTKPVVSTVAVSVEVVPMNSRRDTLSGDMAKRSLFDMVLPTRSKPVMLGMLRALAINPN